MGNHRIVSSALRGFGWPRARYLCYTILTFFASPFQANTVLRKRKKKKSGDKALLERRLLHRHDIVSATPCQDFFRIFDWDFSSPSGDLETHSPAIRPENFRRASQFPRKHNQLIPISHEPRLVPLSCDGLYDISLLTGLSGPTKVRMFFGDDNYYTSI